MSVSERQSFLEARRGGIGSSDVSAILGMSRWKTALDVYLDKVDPVAVDLSQMEPRLEWGLRKEPAIAAAITDHYGWTLVKVPTVTHRDHRFLLASPDRMRVSDGSPNELIEIKTAERADGWGEPETADIPESYWLQVQHQLEVTHKSYECETAWVFVLIGQSDFRRYRVARDPGYIETVLDPLAEFWGMVEARTPPQPDWTHAGTLAALNRLYVPAAGKTVELDATGQSLVDEYERLGAEAKQIAAERDEVKARLIAAMGEAERGELSDGRAVTRKTIDRAGYTVQPSSYVDFRIAKARTTTTKGRRS